MSGKSAQWWRVPAAALLYLSPLLAAAQSSAPAAPGSAPEPQLSVDAATLRRYVGHYQLGVTDIQGVMTVTLEGTQLATQFTGNPSINLYPQSATHFLLDRKVVDADLDFVTNGTGPATGLILHTAGPVVTMTRMNDAAAVQFNAKVAARVQSNTPQPGSQAAVSDFLGRLEKGQPADYSKMGPELAAVAKAQADQTASAIVSLGALQSLTFQRVAPNGADIYQAKFQKGAVVIYIAVDSKGTITSMALQPAQ